MEGMSTINMQHVHATKCHREINKLLQLIYADEYKYANIFGLFL